MVPLGSTFDRRPVLGSEVSPFVSDVTVGCVLCFEVVGQSLDSSPWTLEGIWSSKYNVVDGHTCVPTRGNIL